MFKATKRIAAVTLMAVFLSLALSGCMPTSSGGDGDAAAGGNSLTAFLPLILIIAVFYFLMIRPQNKKNKKIGEMRNALKRGDYVTTIGGLRGRVLRVGDDDVVTIAVGADKVKIDIMRWGISKIDEAAPVSKAARDLEEEPDADQTKRKPKRLTAAPKKEEKVRLSKEEKVEEEPDEEPEEADEDIDDSESENEAEE